MTVRMADSSSSNAAPLSTYPAAPALSDSNTYCRSSCIDSMTIRTSGLPAWICRAASIPFSSAMPTSISTRPGLRARASSTAWRPLPASPTTATSGLDSSRARMPERTSV